MATGGAGRYTKYTGWLLYEEKGLNEYVAIFTVTKDDDTLDDYRDRKHPRAVLGDYIPFTFVRQQDSTLTSRGDYIELKFDTPQDKPTTGWTITPHTVPCRIYRRDVDKVGTPGYPDPPSYSISVHATSPDAVLRLVYTIPVEGVDTDDTLYIRRTLISRLLDINGLQYVLESLNEAGFSQMKWEHLGLCLGLRSTTLEAIEAKYPGDVQGRLRQCLVKWLERADDVDVKGGPRMTSLYVALEGISSEKAAADYIGKNIFYKDSPELRHYREALKTIVRCRLTKAVVQGEARVGKTCFKSLLLDEKYVKASTGIAKLGVGIYCYRRDTGKRYKLLDVTELEEIVKNALKKDAVQKWTNSPVENQVSKDIDEKKPTRGNERAKEDDDRFVDGNEVTDGPGDGDGALGDGNEVAGDEKESSLSKEVEKVLDGVRQCSGKENRLEGAQWLYLIDTGGQIAFQKLLPIFMPFAQVLILVVNISKELSSSSTAVMHIEGKDHSDGSPSRLTVEEVLKQIISSIASGMQHFRDSYKDHKVLRDLVPEKLQILTIGTHGDECSDVEESKRILKGKLAEIIKGNDDCESIEAHHVVRVREIDGRIASAAVEERGKEENFKNTKSSLDDVDEILTKDDKGINIPFYYYFFDIVLRVAAKEGCGVLKLSTCKSLGEDLKLSEDEVMESLNFLHHINSIIYYHDSKACSDLVFVNIGSLIGILKELVGHVHVVHSNEGYAGDDDVIKGILSESKFKEICKNQLDCIAKELKVDDIARKLLNLFLELSIATPIDGKYFIPALLPVRDVRDINPYHHREPLLFYFKKATPMGLFCSVVTHLLSNFSYKIASIESNFSNYIELEYRTKEVAKFYIVLVEQVNCIEAHCEKQRGEGIVREDLKMAIASAAEKHNLSASHEIRFYCSCKRGTAGGGDAGAGGGDAGGGTAGGTAGGGGGVSKGKKHTVEVETVNNEHIFRCSENPRICSDEPPTKWENKIELWSSWLDAGTPNSSTSNDESTSATKQSTAQRSVSETGSTGSPMEAKSPTTAQQSLDITDLQKVLNLLRDTHFNGDWEGLGLQLGLYQHPTLSNLQHTYDRGAALRECLAVWLQRGDGVDKNGGANYVTLANAVERLGQRAAADDIRKQCGIETTQEEAPVIKTGVRTPLPVQEESYIAEEEEEEKPSKKEDEDGGGGVRQRIKNFDPPQPQQFFPRVLKKDSLLGSHDRQRHMLILLYTVFFFFIIYTSSCGQGNFIVPLPGIKVSRSTNVVVPGGKSSTLYLEEFGLVIVSPPGALPAGLFFVINVRLSVAGPYLYSDPDNHTMVAASPVYWLSSSKEFLKPLELGIRHYTSEKAAIKVYSAGDSQRNMSYIFEEVPNVTVSREYVYFSVDHFSGYTLNSTETTFCGTLYFQRSSTNYQWDYNYVMHKCSSRHNFGIENWTVEIKNHGIIFDENSEEIELDIESNPSTDWEAAQKLDLVYTMDDLLSENVTCNMQFSLQWKGGWHLPPAAENLYFSLKGSLRPKRIKVTTQSISYWEHYKDIVIVFVVFFIIIFMLFIAKYYPDYRKGTIGNLLILLIVVLFALVRFLLSRFVSEAVSHPLMALWTKLVGSL